MKKIIFENIDFSYRKKPVLESCHLELDCKVCTAIVGPNGSGKTTLGKLAVGILKPSGGRITYDNEDIADKSLACLGAKVGYLFQNPSKQIFAVTVKDDLTFSLRLNGTDEAVIENKLKDVTDLLHIKDLLDSKCHLLSQGEKQRVALASIFMREPDYIILDEPTTSLDRVRKNILGDILKDIKASGVGILLISHDKSFVHEHADRIIEMETI